MNDPSVQLWIYRHIADTGRAPDLNEIATHFGITPEDAKACLHRLERDAHALVLLPGTPHLWMAPPFSAVPTSFLVRSGARRWWGNCVWDAFGILALLGLDGEFTTACPESGQPLHVTVVNGTLLEAPGVVHFAVPARDWWRDIGFT